MGVLSELLLPADSCQNYLLAYFSFPEGDLPLLSGTRWVLEALGSDSCPARAAQRGEMLTPQGKQSHVLGKAR